jgi:hypothetical protein
MRTASRLSNAQARIPLSDQSTAIQCGAALFLFMLILSPPLGQPLQSRSSDAASLDFYLLMRKRMQVEINS